MATVVDTSGHRYSVPNEGEIFRVGDYFGVRVGGTVYRGTLMQLGTKIALDRNLIGRESNGSPDAGAMPASSIQNLAREWVKQQTGTDFDQIPEAPSTYLQEIPGYQASELVGNQYRGSLSPITTAIQQAKVTPPPTQQEVITVSPTAGNPNERTVTSSTAGTLEAGQTTPLAQQAAQTGQQVIPNMSAATQGEYGRRLEAEASVPQPTPFSQTDPSRVINDLTGQTAGQMNQQQTAPVTPAQQGTQTGSGGLQPGQFVTPNGAIVDAQGNLIAPAGSANPNAPQSGTTGQTGASGGTGTPDLSTLPPEFQQMYSELNNFLAELQKRGQVLNPNIEITPEKTAEFLSQAEREINPYYAGQLKLAKDTLLNSVNYGQQNLLTQEQRAQQQYGTGVRQLGESAAEQGFAQSGLRQRDERQLASDTQNAIDDARNQFSYNAGNAARTFAQQFGSAELPQFNIGQAPRALPGTGSFASGSGSLPLYQLSPDTYSGLVGEQEFARRGQVQSRASQLEEAFRGTQANAQQRQLIL